MNMNDKLLNHDVPDSDPKKETEPKEVPYKNDPYGHDPKGLDIQANYNHADQMDAPNGMDWGCPDDCADIRAASATDCTGLIPALPTSDSELESYSQVFHYPADIFEG